MCGRCLTLNKFVSIDAETAFGRCCAVDDVTNGTRAAAESAAAPAAAVAAAVAVTAVWTGNVTLDCSNDDIVQS